MDGTTLSWGSLLFLGAVCVAAVATGRWRLEAVLGRSDARIGRWAIGVLAIATAFAAAILEPAPMIGLPAAALGISGVWIIGTSLRMARKDRVAGHVQRAITASARSARDRERGPIDSPHGEQDQRAARDP